MTRVPAHRRKRDPFRKQILGVYRAPAERPQDVGRPVDNDQEEGTNEQDRTTAGEN